MTGKEVKSTMFATAMEIGRLPECEEHDLDEDWAAHNADAMLRTLDEIRSLPEGRS